MCANRTVIDNASAFRVLGFHYAEGFAHTVECAGKVSFNNILPLFVGQLVNRYWWGTYASIVENQMIRPNFLPSRRKSDCTGSPTSTDSGCLIVFNAASLITSSNVSLRRAQMAPHSPLYKARGILPIPAPAPVTIATWQHSSWDYIILIF